MTEKMLDRIHIRDLRMRCIVGIYDEERREKQDVVINITLHGDFSAAGASDNIEDAVNYKQVKKKVVALVEQSAFFLVERMAEAIAQVCLEPEGVQRVDVMLDKPLALRFARSVAIEITRFRQ